MTEIKVSIPGAGKNINLAQFIGDASNRVGDARFHVNDACRDADYWFVLETPDPDDAVCRVPRENVVFLTAETAHPPGFYMESPARVAYLRQFGRIITCHDIYLDNVSYDLPFLPWMVNANHGASVFAPHSRDVIFFKGLQSVPKTRDLSVFCSIQDQTATHRMRQRFVAAAKEHFGERLDWFGNGVRSVAEKWEGLAPYRYTIVLENQSASNVLTEKLQDAFLGLCYPIYWGAPNAAKYFPDGAFTAIDIKDLGGSLARIEAILDEDPYQSLLPAIIASKDRVLGEMNFVHRMIDIVRRDGGVGAKAKPGLVKIEIPRARAGGLGSRLQKFLPH